MYRLLPRPSLLADGHSVSFNHDGTVIVYGHNDGYTVHYLDGAKIVQSSTCGSSKEIVVAEKQGKLTMFVSSYSPNALILHKDRKLVDTIRVKGNILSVRLNCKRLVVCTETVLHIYRLPALQQVHQISPTPPNTRGIVDLCAADTSILAYPNPKCNSLGSVNIYDADTMQAGHTINAHESEIAALKLNHDGSMLATASEKGTVVRVFSTRNAQLMYEFTRGTVKNAKIYSLDFCKYSRFLVSSGSTGTIHLYKLDNPLNVNKNNDSLTEMCSNFVWDQVKYVVPAAVRPKSIARCQVPGVHDYENQVTLRYIDNHLHVLVVTKEAYFYAFKHEPDEPLCELQSQKHLNPDSDIVVIKRPEEPCNRRSSASYVNADVLEPFEIPDELAEEIPERKLPIRSRVVVEIEKLEVVEHDEGREKVLNDVMLPVEILPSPEKVKMEAKAANKKPENIYPDLTTLSDDEELCPVIPKSAAPRISETTPKPSALIGLPSPFKTPEKAANVPPSTPKPSAPSPESTSSQKPPAEVKTPIVKSAQTSAVETETKPKITAEKKESASVAPKSELPITPSQAPQSRTKQVPDEVQLRSPVKSAEMKEIGNAKPVQEDKPLPQVAPKPIEKILKPAPQPEVTVEPKVVPDEPKIAPAVNPPQLPAPSKPTQSRPVDDKAPAPKLQSTITQPVAKVDPKHIEPKITVTEQKVILPEQPQKATKPVDFEKKAEIPSKPVPAVSTAAPAAPSLFKETPTATDQPKIAQKSIFASIPKFEPKSASLNSASSPSKPEIAASINPSTSTNNTETPSLPTVVLPKFAPFKPLPQLIKRAEPKPVSSQPKPIVQEMKPVASPVKETKSPSSSSVFVPTPSASQKSLPVEISAVAQGKEEKPIAQKAPLIGSSKKDAAPAKESAAALTPPVPPRTRKTSLQMIAEKQITAARSPQKAEISLAEPAVVKVSLPEVTAAPKTAIHRAAAVESPIKPENIASQKPETSKLASLKLTSLPAFAPLKTPSKYESPLKESSKSDTNVVKKGRNLTEVFQAEHQNPGLLSLSSDTSWSSNPDSSAMKKSSRKSPKKEIIRSKHSSTSSEEGASPQKPEPRRNINKSPTKVPSTSSASSPPASTTSPPVAFDPFDIPDFAKFADLPNSSDDDFSDTPPVVDDMTIKLHNSPLKPLAAKSLPTSSKPARVDLKYSVDDLLSDSDSSEASSPTE